MTTRYRVEYALKTHRRDQLIEWIKGLLAVPFVLHSQPVVAYRDQDNGEGGKEGRGEDVLGKMAKTAHRRYKEILRDVEDLINDHISHQNDGTQARSKLKLLVPSVGVFFTPLLLEEAFEYQDRQRRISSRRFVPPSFNDIRLILNSAQVLGLVRDGGRLELVTFDGDVTLYDDGQSLNADNPVIPRILNLLAQGTKVGIVTAAGYTEAKKYYHRLHGLLEATKAAVSAQKMSNNNNNNNPELIILGGESNFLFRFDADSPYLLRYIDRSEWLLPEMRTWSEEDIQALLDVAENALRECITNMDLSAEILRKERAVGIVPKPTPSTSTNPNARGGGGGNNNNNNNNNNKKFTREQLEETVLVTQQVVELCPSSAQKRIPFCAFNGGSDVFVDIGDKGWGVLACQRYLGGVRGSRTLHIGDQFLSSGGANDFKARLACTTAWIASPDETVRLLDELGMVCEGLR